MSNVLTGLKYHPPIFEVKTEEQLLQVFADLREQYQKFSKDFRITTRKGSPLENFEQFLRIALKEQDAVVVLNGSGDVDGLNIQDGSLEYDLSFVGEGLIGNKPTWYWDQSRDGSCLGCRNYGSSQDDLAQEVRYSCNLGYSKTSNEDCPKYDARIRNSEGEPARKLSELILEAAK